jgi:hypothetical protein
VNSALRSGESRPPVVFSQIRTTTSIGELDDSGGSGGSGDCKRVWARGKCWSAAPSAAVGCDDRSGGVDVVRRTMFGTDGAGPGFPRRTWASYMLHSGCAGPR